MNGEHQHAPDEAASDGLVPYLVAIGISACVWLFTPCMCGHLPPVALPFSALACALAWCPFVQLKRDDFGSRAFAVGFVVIATFTLIKNTADVLWFGHGALYEYPF